MKTARHLRVNRITTHRFERYRRRPDDDTAARMAALPNFPLSKDEILADFRRNVPEGAR